MLNILTKAVQSEINKDLFNDLVENINNSPLLQRMAVTFNTLTSEREKYLHQMSVLLKKLRKLIELL